MSDIIDKMESIINNKMKKEYKTKYGKVILTLPISQGFVLQTEKNFFITIDLKGNIYSLT